MSKNKKFIEQVIYSLLLEYPESSFLSVQYAYSLEEAIYKAKEEYSNLQKKISGNSFIDTFAPKLSLFTSKNLDELVKNSNVTDELFEHYQKLQDKKKKIEVKSKCIKNDKVRIKNNNALMKEIIDKKDNNLLQESIKKLSKNEVLYIKSKLK